MAERPIGVIIIAILQLISALVTLAGGALTLLAGLAIPFLGIILIAIGAVLLIFGIIGLILFWGLWGMKSWAWLLTLLINFLNLIINAYNVYTGLPNIDYMAIINVAIPLIIVIYLFFVREHFR